MSLALFESPFLLVIYPEFTDFSIDSQYLIKLLQERELLGDKDTENRFQVGEKFLSNITFLGCSPDIELYPQQDKPYCYIEIPMTTSNPRFYSGVNVKPPRCRSCKKELSDLPKQLKESITFNQQQFECQHCQQVLEPLSYNWRKTACFSHNRIIIGNIYESEAVPDENLLSALLKGTGVSWKYCYIRTA